jgi:hypothetical protein
MDNVHKHNICITVPSSQTLDLMHFYVLQWKQSFIYRSVLIANSYLLHRLKLKWNWFVKESPAEVL